MEKIEAVLRVCIEVSQALLEARARPIPSAVAVVLEKKLADARALLYQQGGLGLPLSDEDVERLLAAVRDLGDAPSLPMTIEASAARALADDLPPSGSTEGRELMGLDLPLGNPGQAEQRTLEEGDAPGTSDVISAYANKSDPDHVS